jgi:hypothetical protein
MAAIGGGGVELRATALAGAAGILQMATQRAELSKLLARCGRLAD